MTKDTDGDVATTRQNDPSAHEYIGRGIPWSDFLHYRLRLIHAFVMEGKTPEQIAHIINVDVVQVQLLSMTPLDYDRPRT